VVVARLEICVWCCQQFQFQTLFISVRAMVVRAQALQMRLERLALRHISLLPRIQQHKTLFLLLRAVAAVEPQQRRGQPVQRRQAQAVSG
jgi:hypothetical protein